VAKMWRDKQSNTRAKADETEQPKQAESGRLDSLATDSSTLKVKFAFKALAFCASVVTLSWFFEGWRRIHTAVDLGSTVLATSILVAGVVVTSLLIVVQAFWIYIEEKQKGSCVRRLELFEKLYSFFVQRKRAAGISKRGEETKHA